MSPIPRLTIRSKWCVNTKDKRDLKWSVVKYKRQHMISMMPQPSNKIWGIQSQQMSHPIAIIQEIVFRKSKMPTRSLRQDRRKCKIMAQGYPNTSPNHKRMSSRIQGNAKKHMNVSLLKLNKLLTRESQIHRKKLVETQIKWQNPNREITSIKIRR